MGEDLLEWLLAASAQFAELKKKMMENFFSPDANGSPV
jgi:hypothetical protein